MIRLRGIALGMWLSMLVLLVVGCRRSEPRAVCGHSGNPLRQRYCVRLPRPFARAPAGSVTSFAGDGFIFEEKGRGFVRYSASRGVDRVGYAEARFRPAAYFDGNYYGVQHGHIVRNRTLRGKPVRVGDVPWASERTLAIDQSGIYFTDTEIRVLRGEKIKRLATGLPPASQTPLELRNNGDGFDGAALNQHIQVVALGPDQLYVLQSVCWKYVDHFEAFGRIYAMSQAGADAHQMAVGEGLACVTADDRWVYYADGGAAYCRHHGEGKPRKFLSERGRITALGVDATHLYVAVQGPSSNPHQPTIGLSEGPTDLYRLRKPVCRDR